MWSGWLVWRSWPKKMRCPLVGTSWSSITSCSLPTTPAWPSLPLAWSKPQPRSLSKVSNCFLQCSCLDFSNVALCQRFLAAVNWLLSSVTFPVCKGGSQIHNFVFSCSQYYEVFALKVIFLSPCKWHGRQACVTPGPCYAMREPHWVRVGLSNVWLVQCINRISSTQRWAMGVLGQGLWMSAVREVFTQMSSCSKGETRRLIPALWSVHEPQENVHPPSLQGGAIWVHLKFVT